MAASLEYHALAPEKDRDVSRLEDEVRGARCRRGQGVHPHDLRAVDVPTPKRRRKTLRRLALRLRAVSQDAEWLQELILDPGAMRWTT